MLQKQGKYVSFKNRKRRFAQIQDKCNNNHTIIYSWSESKPRPPVLELLGLGLDDGLKYLFIYLKLPSLDDKSNM